MPRPEDINLNGYKRYIIVGGIVLVLVIVASTFAMCAGSGQQGKTSNIETQQQASTTPQAETSALQDIDQVGNKAALQFMGADDQNAFAGSLKEWMSQNGKAWPGGAQVVSVANQTESTAEIYVKLDDGTYLCCVWVGGTANPFKFMESSEAEANSKSGYSSASSLSSSQQQQQQATSSQQMQQQQRGSSAGSGSSASTSTSPMPRADRSSSSSASESSSSKEPAVAASPVKASDTQTLLKYLPEKPAYYLATVTGNYLKGKGIVADGGSAIVDATTVRKGGVGYTFSGYVTDSTGTKRAIEWEWNESRQQYGMKVS